MDQHTHAPLRILISGASIAGLTLAYWLHRYHFDVTVVELSAGPRKGGSPIDVRGKALEVAERMGILPQLQAAKTGTDGMSFVNASGKLVAQVRPDDMNAPEDIELRRDYLVNTLFATTHGKVEYLFEDTIQAFVQDNEGVEVTFAHSSARKFDLVIGADGLHSVVRRLAFGQETQFVYHLGLYVGLIELTRTINAPQNQITFYNTPGRAALLARYPDQDYAMFVFRSPELTYDYHSVSAKKELLLNAFAQERGWKVPDMLAAVEAADDLYFDAVSQIRMPTWSQGRVVLIGDAAHCAAFLSGQGSTLAMVDAAVLADELAASPGDYRRAFAAYEARLKPDVDALQVRVPGAVGFFAPTTSFGIWTRNTVLRLAQLLTVFKEKRAPEPVQSRVG